MSVIQHDTDKQTIIVADDDTAVISALQMLLKSQGFEVVAVTNPEAIISHVEKTEFAAALIDLNYQNDTTSGKEGLALIETLKSIDELLPIVVMSGYSSVEIAVEAMKLGAGDFIQKPWSNERLLHILRTQIQLKDISLKGTKLAQENDLLKSEINNHSTDIVVNSSKMRALLAQLKKLAQSDMSILLTGENGTGKSMFAEFIHQHSIRNEQPFISVNMGAVPDNLFESEMFGHVKGAFTDAKESRMGRFELAQNGTIFLDEIANISLNGQAKLLRVLEERQFEKVGSNKTQHVNVRVLSATNADIEGAIKNSEFRQDLFYRLNTVSIEIPALRDRIEDLVPLVHAFMQKHASKYRLEMGHISDEALQALQHYDWPGNIRELGHVIERAMFLRTDTTIELKDIAIPKSTSLTNKNQPNEEVSTHQFDTLTLEQIEKQIIKSRLAAFDYHPQTTADSLGLSRSAYYRRLEKYKLA